MAHPSNELPDTTLDALIARERARVVAPLTEWHTLSAQLREEGLLRSSGEPAQPAVEASSAHGFVQSAVHGSERLAALPPREMRHGGGGWRRFIAGAALLGIGVVIGAGSKLATIVETHVQTHGQTHATDTVAANDTKGGDSVDAIVRPVGNSAEPFASPEAARQVLLKAQNDYQRAAAYLAASDTSAQIVGSASHRPEVYQQRLAALDAVMSATQRALKESPHDPLLHQYYQSTVGAREATEQQLAQVIPVGMQVSRF